MKLRPLICCAALLAVPAWAADKPMPEAHPAGRYATMVEKSPFALATAAAPVAEAQASFAANWYVAGIAKLGDTDFVTIKSRDASQIFSLIGREPQNGVSVASIEWSETIGKSKVILQKGTETAKLEFNEADLRGPAPSTNAPNVAATKPGQPGVPNNPGVVVTPPGSNNAPRPGFPSRPTYPGGMPQPGFTTQQGGTMPPGANNLPGAVPQPGTTMQPGQTGAPGQPPPGGEIRRRVRVIGAPQ